MASTQHPDFSYDKAVRKYTRITQSLVGISSAERSHLQEIERANAERLFHAKKLVTRSEVLHMHEDYLASVQTRENERRRAVKKVHVAEKQYSVMLAVQDAGAERPYHDSLANYRSWQESQAAKLALASEPSQELATRPNSTSRPRKIKAGPLVLTTPLATSKQQPQETSSIAVQEPAISAHGLAWLAASVRPIESDETTRGNIEAFHWQIQGLVPLDVSEDQTQRHIDWNTVRPGYLDGAPPALRRLYCERTSRARTTSTVNEGCEQSLDQALDTRATTQKLETSSTHDGPPSIVDDEVSSACGEPSSEPQTPIAELPAGALFGTSEFKDVKTLEEHQPGVL